MQKILLFMLFSPYLLIRGIGCFLFEVTVGRKRILKIIDEETSANYKYELMIVAIAKNEAHYIREWIAYYIASCGSKVHITLYDNDSEDELKAVIQDFIDSGHVTYIYFPGEKMQLVAYDDAISKFKDIARYMAFVDVDEFIVPTKDDNLACCLCTLLSEYKAPGIGINWKIFGSSGEKSYKNELLMTRFIRRAENDFWGNEHVKTIANPRLIRRYIRCHYPIYRLGGWSINSKGKRQRLWINTPVDFEELSVNHYFCKSEEEFWIKQGRGFADCDGSYTFNKFVEYDKNEIEDVTILKYVNTVKSIMDGNIVE